ncbi:MAG TPA: condensation domain-containing protein, partial [Gemmatimonadales bacterium]|nr:condensation domain-containing protein [Gemmatimonadales bacterium]
MQLLNGHTLYVVPEEVRQDPSALIKFCKQNSLDVLDCTPTVLGLLLAEGLLEEAVPAVVFVGGEPIDQHTWELLAASQRISFYNVYGPTECTVNATISPVSKEQKRASIGGSLTNVQVYILDRDLSPVPIGVRGEIYIGGAGVGRGYTGRPDLTAERFVPDPYSDAPGSRLYKTGDQARYFADGKIDFIGRLDQQVKVRGYRIEPGEIEAALEQHPAVANAAVVMGQRSASDAQLLAYLVASSPIDDALLRSFLADSLPQYMIPAVFITLESLPLTASGKLDRLALPDPPTVTSRPERLSYSLDRPTQTAIAEVWTEVLGLDHVGLDDNFFNLGGHSLLATQAASRLRQYFNIELPLRKLFEAPTVRELAAVIDSELSPRQKGTEIRARERHEPVALSYAQQRLWFLDQLEPGSDSYNIAAALRLEGSLNEEALGRALQEVVRRHEVLRTRIEVIGTAPYQVIDESVVLSLPLIDLSELEEQSRGAAAEGVKREEASAGFNLSTGPVLRAKLIKQGAQDHLLLVTMHHIVSDGWSIGVLVKEFSALYEAYRRGEESPLPELPVQYADYALWQREWLQGEVLDEQLRYWEEKLAGAPAMIELPADRARGAFRAGGGTAGRVRVEFD